MTQKEKEQFKEFGLSSILDLVIVTPTSYEDLTLKQAPILDTNQLIDATIKSYDKISYKDSKILKTKTFCT